MIGTRLFSAMRRFSLDGPDSLYTYVKTSETNIRQIRQCEGGGILVWAMVMPNGLITHRIIRGMLKASDYHCILKEQGMFYSVSVKYVINDFLSYRVLFQTE